MRRSLLLSMTSLIAGCELLIHDSYVDIQEADAIADFKERVCAIDDVLEKYWWSRSNIMPIHMNKLRMMRDRTLRYIGRFYSDEHLQSLSSMILEREWKFKELTLTLWEELCSSSCISTSFLVPYGYRVMVRVNSTLSDGNLTMKALIAMSLT